MNITTQTETDRTAQRVAIERVIARYPQIDDEELVRVLHYFRSEASALDQATIASNEAIAGRYRQLCRDHRLDRLGKVETLVVSTFFALLALVLVLHALGFWER